ncbi:MAG TPA: hypothetical protein VFG64_04720 [Dongiaceae bacterium]|nr:hypothetical protein [Dongiaceae bacterium]
MSKIELDPGQLSGFRLIARGGSALMLRSPKIGGKLCATSTEMALATNSAALRAKVGTKTD